jgi:serine/threonine protein kinase
VVGLFASIGGLGLLGHAPVSSCFLDPWDLGPPAVRFQALPLVDFVTTDYGHKSGHVRKMLLSGRGQWPIIAGVHDVRTAIKLMLDRIGKYRVIREIGKGATATVYLCKSDDLDELVAVKLVDFGDKNRDQGKWSRRMRKLFLTEAAIAAKLDHPNIIRIFDAQVEEGRAYLVMEYIEGEALDHYCEFNKMLRCHVP